MNSIEPMRIEPAGDRNHGPCECCGSESKCVWGFVHGTTRCIACYFVHWTLGRIADHGATFDVILGEWGEGTSAANRQLVSLAYGIVDRQPQFMVVDADQRPAARSDLVGQALHRTDIVDGPIAAQVFEIVDLVLRDDSRVGELLGQPPVIGLHKNE